MNDYPSRVTLGDDGVYRWSYDMDMWRNRYMLALVSKVLGVMCAGVCAMMLALLGPAYLKPMTFIIMGLSVAGLYALTLGIYLICALVMRGKYHLRFEMNEEAVTFLQSDATKQRNNVLGMIANLAGSASGNMRGARRVGNALSLAEIVGITYYSNIVRVKPRPKWDLIHIYEWMGMNQIYVNPEDLPFVRDYIMARARKK